MPGLPMIHCRQKVTKASKLFPRNYCMDSRTSDSLLKERSSTKSSFSLNHSALNYCNRAIEDAIEHVGVLIALRTAPESLPLGKGPQRHLRVVITRCEQKNAISALVHLRLQPRPSLVLRL